MSETRDPFLPTRAEDRTDENLLRVISLCRRNVARSSIVLRYLAECEAEAKRRGLTIASR